jgi:hypothetical protein
MASLPSAVPADDFGIVSNLRGPAVGPELGAAEVVTTHLPLVHNDYWIAPDSVLGVQLYSDHREQEAVVKTTQMGARWARVPIYWSWIEPANTTPDNYQWPSSFDDWLARLSARNVQVILTLAGNPPWAATYSGGVIDQVDISELVEFMATAVARYSGPPYNIKHWEFYNEPDNGDEIFAEKGWGYWGNDPEAYAQMLVAVYQPMKTADPEAQILFGGLAYDWWTSVGGPFVEEFLDGVLQYDGGNSFDIMNFHYYPSFRGNWEPYGPDIVGKANYIRNKLASFGVDKPLICTEACQWSDEAHGGSEELQSRYVPQVFARSMAADLDTTIWFRLVDWDGIGIWKYGLLNSDLSPKPAYDAYSTFTRQMASANYVHTLGPGETGSDQIEAYSFLAPRGPTSVIVAWTEDEQEHDMWLLADQVVVVDKFGAEITIDDADDGIVDSQVWVTVGASPLYLRFAP